MISSCSSVHTTLRLGIVIFYADGLQTGSKTVIVVEEAVEGRTLSQLHRIYGFALALFDGLQSII